MHRRWKFDFATASGPQYAIEIEGHGRHTSWMGFRKDVEKYNAALALGWKVIRAPASAVFRNAEGVVDEVWQIMCGCVPTESVMVQ